MRSAWTFSTEVLTLGDMIDVKRSGAGDLEALARVILRRAVPPTTMDEVRQIRSDELPLLLEQLTKSIQDAGNFKPLVDRLGLQ